MTDMLDYQYESLKKQLELQPILGHLLGYDKWNI